MGASFLSGPAPIAAESPLDFLDDFTAGSPGPLLSGRKPLAGQNGWIVTGGGLANARAGGPAGFTSAADGGTIYAVMRLNGGAVPAEIGGVFRWTGGPATAPTIAILKDYAAHGFDVMWHANLYMPSLSAVTFAPGYWLAGQVNVPPTDNRAQFGALGGTSGPLALGQDYVRRIFLDQLPFLFETLELPDGTVLATHAVYEPNLAGVVGPWVFFEGQGPDLHWSKVWARNAPSGRVSSAVARFRGGLDATPIGKLAPASGRFSAVHAGPGLPSGVLSARMTIASDTPTILGTNIVPELRVKPESPGFGSKLSCFNAGGHFGSMAFGGDYVQSFTVNDTPWLSKSFGGDAFLAAGLALRLGGAAGPRVAAGSGPPDGAVAAPVGSLYLRTDGGAGSSLYVKETGTGASGWTAR